MAVIAGPVATLTVSPDTVTLAAGDTITFSAIGLDAHGNRVASIPTLTVMTMNPVNPYVEATVTETFTVSGHDRFNNTRAVTVSAWSISGGNPGTITSDGVYTALSFVTGIQSWRNSIVANAKGSVVTGGVIVICLAAELCH